ncbi:MAG: beta-galactosidase, partial [Acidobacteriota bacterium]
MRIRSPFFVLLLAGVLLLPALPSRALSDIEGRVSYVGVNGHIPSTQDFERMREAGIHWVRVDFTWDVVEPKPGHYRWTLLDRVVADAERNGVNLLAILGYTPKWASAGPDRYSPPRDTQEWKTFVATIVARYRGRIRHWSLWNEPNSDTFFHGTVEHFIREVFIPGANAAKAANPDCRIVGPDLAHLSGSDWDKWL